MISAPEWLDETEPPIQGWCAGVYFVGRPGPRGAHYLAWCWYNEPGRNYVVPIWQDVLRAANDA